MSDKSKRPSDPADAVPKCGCAKRDSWRCAVDRGLTTSIACHCNCHRATPAHAQRQDAQPAAPSAQAATGWIVVKEHAWDHDDSESSTLAYLWPSEFERQVFATFDEACAFMKEEPALPLGWVAMQISLPTTQPAGAAVEAVAKLIRPCPPGKGVIQKFPTKTGATTVIPNENALLLPPGEYDLYAASPQQRSGQDGVDAEVKTP